MQTLLTLELMMNVRQPIWMVWLFADCFGTHKTWTDFCMCCNTDILYTEAFSTGVLISETAF